ncbi:MAG TPA: hypothetical protein VHE61_03865 [Opitutaceae bacterium]|nr:hypothetical protein [Opitutaceae bacterium]
MKTLRFLLALSAIAALVALSGCDTFQARARQKSEVYNALPPGTQQRLQRGQISIGDSQDMVYIALGYPDEVRQVTTPQGVQTIWIYRTYWQQYEGTAWVGWHRVIVPLRNGHGYAIFHEPVTTDVYRTHADEVIRVTFNNGVVASVVQHRRP